MVDGAKEVLFHTAGSQSQEVRDFFTGPSFHIAEGKDLLLARRQQPKGAPDAFLLFAAHDLLFGSAALIGDMVVRQFHLFPSPPFPPARPSPVVTGVDGDSPQPRLPGKRLIAQLAWPQELEKDFLRHLVGFGTVVQEEETQPHNARMLRPVQGFILLSLIRHDRIVLQPLLAV